MTVVDDGLPTLALAMDRSIANVAMRPLLASQWSDPLPSLARVELLKIRPGRRAVLRYDFVVDPSGRDSLVLIGKLRAKGADRRVDRVGRALRGRGFDERGDMRFVVPQHVGCVPELSLQLQRFHSGRPISQLLSRSSADPLLAGEIGAALAELHNAGVPSERIHRVADELAILENGLALAARERPELALRIDSLLATARSLSSSLAHRPPGPVHRDFHPDQILFDGESLVLLDLDLYALADPLVDVSNFVAHVREQALRERGDERAYRGFESGFLSGYERASGCALDGPALSAWVFLSLLRHVSIASRIPARRPYQEAIVTACERSEVHAKAD